MPLVGAELEKLILKVQSKDLDESDLALSTIIEAYQGLIMKVAYSQFRKLASLYNQTSNSLLAFEDVLSVAQLNFINAVRSYSSSNHPNFVTYCSMNLKFGLYEFVKKFQGPCYLPEHIFRKKKKTRMLAGL